MIFLIKTFLTFLLSSMDCNLVELKKNNTIYIDDIIDKNILTNIKSNLLNYNHDIYIYIDSPGGDIFSGMKIIDYIEYLSELKNKNIYCVAHNAYSMAFGIFQHCPNRFITKHSVLMQHKLYVNIEGNLKNVDNYIKMAEKINRELDKKTLLNINKKRILSNNTYKHFISDDWWLYGEEILDWGLADKIIKLNVDYT